MRKHGLAGPVIDALAAHPTRRFADRAAWRAHLAALGLDRPKVTPDPVKLATEGALWGSVCAHGLLRDAAIVSDEAGQFRVGRHALCWVHAERLVHKLIPRNERQRRAVALVRQLIRWFHADLEEAYRRGPCPRRRAALRARLDRIFRRSTTGLVALDRRLAGTSPARTSRSWCRSGPRSRCIPTARGTIRAATSSSARSPAARTARPAVWRATPCSGC
ncbi:MAG TPA: hypothetical protein VFG47_12155 [Geminicoccaceae bacterium]|nr:hypothetical protein [Geminicoccaceae bacterium]